MRNITPITIENLRVWLLNRRAKAKATKFVIGLSGGIDSAVVAALCARADKDNTVAVILPCYSDPKSESDARKVAAAIGIEAHKVDLGAAHAALWPVIDKELSRVRHTRHGDKDEIADTNTRSRLRMVALYAIANALNGIVVGTDNACENYVGFFTKYGDGGVDMNPIARYVKSEVRALGRLLGIPEEIVTKTPTADLRFDKPNGRPNTDEAELGVTYDQLDAYLLDMMYGGGENIAPVDPAICRRIEQMHLATQHKRDQPYEPDDAFAEEPVQV